MKVSLSTGYTGPGGSVTIPDMINRIRRSPVSGTMRSMTVKLKIGQAFDTSHGVAEQLDHFLSIHHCSLSFRLALLIAGWLLVGSLSPAACQP